MAKTVVGLFDTAYHAQDLIHALVEYGIDRDNISLMAPPPGVFTRDPSDNGANVVAGAGLGAALGGVGGLLMGLALLPVPGFGPVFAAGPIVATLAGAGIGAATGSLLGVLTEIGVPAEHAVHYAEAVRRGGTLVSVNVVDHMAEHVALIMDRHHAVNIRERVSAWRDGGWEGFSPYADVNANTVVLAATEPDRLRDSDALVTSRVVRQSDVIPSV